MHIQPIKNSKDYEEALQQVQHLMDSELDTEAGDQLEILATLIEVYEEKNFPIEIPDPIEAIKFRMEQENLSRKDLETIFGTRARVSEILSKKRALTLSMIRNIHEKLGIPARVLIKSYTINSH